MHLAALEEAWRRDPLALFVRLAGAYLDRDRLDDARAVLDHGLAARPGHLAGRVCKARLALARQHPGEARAELDEVLALRDDHWDALRLLAEVARSTGDPGGELEAVDRMLAVLPEDERLAARRAELEADDGERPRMPRRPAADPAGSVQTEPARAAAPQPGLPAVGRRPRPLVSDPFVNATMAELLAAQGDVEGAQEMLLALVERSPGRQDLRARFVEVGGDAGRLPAPAPPPSPEPTALADALEGLVE